MADSKGLHGLEVWQDARALAGKVYVLSRDFPAYEQYGLVSQLRRSAVSVMSNIAEGYGRYSRKDFSHFLHMARGSLLELKSLCILSADLGFLRTDQCEEIEVDCNNVGRRLNALLRSLQQAGNGPVNSAVQSKADQAPSAKRQAQTTKE